MKSVLVVYYSQTGQLKEIVDSTIAPLIESNVVELTCQELKVRDPYPFPWPFWRFFDTFPETVYEEAPLLEPPDIRVGDRFDLVIIAYQVWFLSPSPPTIAFLNSEEAKSVLANTPVITLIGCRNMWLMAQERMKTILEELGARLIDNAVLIDSAHSAFTFVSTPLWMLTGRRGPFLGDLIPAAGVSEDDIAGCHRFGRAIAEQLPALEPEQPQSMLAGLGAVTVNEQLIASERIARRSFQLWGGLLRAAGRPGTLLRRAILVFYVAFLIMLILTVVPVSAVLRRLIAPLKRAKTAEERAYFAAPSGESDHLMGRHSL